MSRLKKIKREMYSSGYFKPEEVDKIADNIKLSNFTKTYNDYINFSNKNENIDEDLNKEPIINTKKYIPPISIENENKEITNNIEKDTPKEEKNNETRQDKRKIKVKKVRL